MSDMIETTVLIGGDTIMLLGNPNDWESEAQQAQYYQKAVELFEQYRVFDRRLEEVLFDREMTERLTWEDVFHPEDSLKGVSYDRDPVQTSNISNIPEQMVIQAEQKLEANRRRFEQYDREEKYYRDRMKKIRSKLYLLRGRTRDVAEYLWFDKSERSQDDIADLLQISRATLFRERSSAIDEIAKHLRIRDYRDCMSWMR